MDANISTSRLMPSIPFEHGSAMPPYPHPHPIPNQHPHPHPPHPASHNNSFGLSNNQHFDANWFANFPPPPPPPPPFGQVTSRPLFDSSGAPMFPQMPFIPPSNPIPLQNPLPQTDGPLEQPLPPSKDRAKEAILLLVRADITYDDLVKEGVKASLLATLFAELNIPLPKPAVEPAQRLDPAMERKDRIAKLLAAKKSQSATASPKEPANHIGVAVTPENNSRTESPLLPVVQETMREKNANGFSIPGLFMTSAEQEEILQSNALPKGRDALEVQQAYKIAQEDEQISLTKDSAFAIELEQPSATLSELEPPSKQPQSPTLAAKSEIKSLKRGPEPFSTDIMPHPKRLVSTSQDATIPSDPVRAVEYGVNAVRSKVNQNVLKDRMAALKADLLLRNTRKKALQDGMPVLNAEVQKTRERLQDNQSRLRHIRSEIESKTGELTKLRDEESVLQEEVERLEDQLADGETGQQQFSRELTQLNDQIMADENESRASHHPNLLGSPVGARTDVFSQPRPFSGEGSNLVHIPTVEVSHPQHDYIPDVENGQNFPALTQDGPQVNQIEYSPEQENVDRQLNVEAAFEEAQTPHDDLSYLGSANALTEVGSQQVSTTAATSEMDSEQDSEDDRMSIDEVSDLESVGSASMSDSGSDEYEPPIHIDLTAEPEEKDNDDYEPQDIVTHQQSASHEAENDDYEPSEQVDVLNVEVLQDLQRTEDHSGVSTAETSNLEVGDLSYPRPLELAIASSTQTSDKQTSPALTPENADAETPIVNLVEPLSNPRERLSSVPHFVPYSSPLSNMKQFRFNPQFNDVVKNGYRSLTYSHQIDKDIPLCPTELGGVTCVDGDCEEQHFSRFALSDDKILVQMSSANHIKDKGQRDGYLIGLKKVIADLRERGVKEFSEVANALAAYRRDQAMSQAGLFA